SLMGTDLSETGASGKLLDRFVRACHGAQSNQITWRLLPEALPPVVAVAAAGAVVSVGAATGAVVSVGAATGAIVFVGTGTGVAVGVSPPQAARNGTTTISSATMSANRLYALYITLLLKRHLPESIVLSDNYIV